MIVNGLDVSRVSRAADRPTICAAHPASVFGEQTALLLAEMADANVVVVDPRRGTLEQMVDELEAVRVALELPPWVFWGMSGGGWLALLYAHRHPEAVSAIVVESACACFRARLADPACALSPSFPAWSGMLVNGAPGWAHLDGVGEVFRDDDGSPLVVSPVAIDELMRAAMPELLRFDARAWIGDLRVPTLVIAGTADPVVPLHRVREVHERIAGSSFVAVDGGGHVPTAQKSPAVREAVRRFLR